MRNEYFLSHDIIGDIVVKRNLSWWNDGEKCETGDARDAASHLFAG